MSGGAGEQGDEAWRAALQRGDGDTAWDLFIGRYRRLIFAAIRHYTREHDEVMDVFAEVCEALRQNELAWSPDGKQIAFTSVLERRLAVMDVDGVGQPKSMLNNPTSVDVMGCSFSGLDWSPDGQTLAVRGQTPDVPDMGLVAIDVRTGASRRLVPGSDDRDMDPAWYPVQP